MSKKYEIIKNGLDDYTLKYKDQEINFNSNVDLNTKMQSVYKKARIKMIQELGQAGMTVKELTKEIKKDGKTYYDNSNKEELEKAYIEDEKGNVFLECVKEMTGKDFTELMTEIGIEEEKEAAELGKELGEVLSGTFPSNQK